jgi:hypothetical protein
MLGAMPRAKPKTIPLTMPGFLPPIEAVAADRPPTGARWAYEVKWDGWHPAWICAQLKLTRSGSPEPVPEPIRQSPARIPSPSWKASLKRTPAR